MKQSELVERLATEAMHSAVVVLECSYCADNQEFRFKPGKGGGFDGVAREAVKAGWRYRIQRTMGQEGFVCPAHKGERL